MNTKLPDDQTGWLGTYDYELVSYLNNQLFGDQPQSETDTGYGLQSLTIQDYNDTTLQLFKYRIIHNIKDGYPSFIQIQVDDLFGNDSNIETTFTFLDPYFSAQEGFMVSSEQLFHAMIISDEPSCIW